MKLVIVESPTKTKTLGKYLGKRFEVAATLGHVRDLPKKSFGVDLKSFEPQYETIRGKKKVIKKLKKLEKEADEVILATDLDREGEAIAWHTKEALGVSEYQRIVFHEITKQAIKKALQNPRKIDENLINAQQARRILDRIVGYKLSPLLWKKVAKGLSAGRVQSVALRLITEREREIEKFTPRDYWSVHAFFKHDPDFNAKLREIKKERLKKFSIASSEEAKEIIQNLEDEDFIVEKITKKKKKRFPFAPFITSTLQQEGWYKFSFSSKQTIYLAQQLYEKGLITYHRTDSLHLSKEATDKAEKIILKEFGEKYWPGKKRSFKTKSTSAQEAHEAIRPAHPEKKPSDIKLKGGEEKLYRLIWQRFIASQMNPAVFNQARVGIKAGEGTFRATGQTLLFDGFLKVYPVRFKENLLPALSEGEKLDLEKLKSKKHSTRPPARWSEATLIKEMKKLEIGRPSTYAPIISVIQERNYVGLNQKKRFYPTDLGKTVNDLLVKHFPKIVNVEFTARMEKNLDKVAGGKKEWKEVLREFWKPFKENLDKKYEEIEKKVEKTDKECPECGAPLILRMSKYGKFYGCSKFPECKYTKPILKKVGVSCPQCEEGEIIEKRTRKGKIFYGCSRWPKCDFALWEKPTGDKCPECGSLVTINKKGRVKCSNKECEWQG